MLEFLRNKKIIIIVAHPDDEILGLGGTMNKLINEYDVETRVVILGEGITSRSNKRDLNKWKKELETHKENIFEAARCIGYHDVKTYDFPDNRFDSVDILDIIKIIEKEIEEFCPNVIFTHHIGDLNVDHQVTFQAVVTATRPVTDEIVKTIISFETPSGTEWIPSTDLRKFIPNIHFEISKANLKSKIKAMESYNYEKRKYPHPRSPESLKILAEYRGINVGLELAESFCLVRNIN